MIDRVQVCFHMKSNCLLIDLKETIIRKLRRNSCTFLLPQAVEFKERELFLITRVWQVLEHIGEYLYYFLFLLVSRTGTVGWTECWVLKCALAIIASNSLHNHGDQKYHAHVTTLRILNKFIEINFSVGCMVWPWYCLLQDNNQ